jgi:hypothetical protein
MWRSGDGFGNDPAGGLSVIRSVTIAVILAFAGSATVASAIGSVQYCCACRQSQGLEASGANNGTSSTALFCLSTNSNSTAEAAADRCNDLTGGLFLCVADGRGSCHNDLAAVGITCPATAAPTAGGASLLSLALILGACGTLALRRRRHRDVRAVER